MEEHSHYWGDLLNHPGALNTILITLSQSQLLLLPARFDDVGGAVADMARRETAR